MSFFSFFNSFLRPIPAPRVRVFVGKRPGVSQRQQRKRFRWSDQRTQRQVLKRKKRGGMTESHPTKRKIQAGTFKLTTLEALALLVLNDAFMDYQGVYWLPDDLVRLWRRYCASNLSYEQWRKKAWSEKNYGDWCRESIEGLKKLGLASDGPWITDSGRAVALIVRDRFQQAMPIARFVKFTQATYDKVSGRIGA